MGAPAAPVPARRGGRLGMSLAIAALVVVLDQLTKWWAVEALDDGEIHLFWTVRLILTFNKGMAFSRGEGLGPVIGFLAVIIVVVLLVGLRRGGSRLAAVATGMVVGGAVGNVLDRIFRGGADGVLHGRVIDFVDLGPWPVFNVADIGVTIGAILLFLSSWFASAEPPAPVPVPSESSGEPEHHDA